MKTNHTRCGWQWAVFVLLVSLMTPMAFVGAVHGASAEGISAPLYIGNLDPILDPYGRPMPGCHAGPIQSLVELRVATNNLVIAPHVNGMSHPFNPVLLDCTGGMGLNTCSTNNGLFCMVLPKRPGGDVQVFARAYNAPTAAEATFYADSELVNLSDARTSELVLTFQKTRALDGRDDDGDGLNNSWERLLGTDQPGGVSPEDWDGDGMSDLHEMLAGTDPTDAGSMLAFRIIEPDSSPETLARMATESTPVRVEWQSVPGKTYRLEHIPLLAAIDPETGEPYAFSDDLDGDGEKDPPIIAGEGETNISVWVDVGDALTGVFRVKLVQE